MGVYGRPMYAQQPYVEPPYAQPGYGQPVYGQPYGYGQAPYRYDQHPGGGMNTGMAMAWQVWQLDSSQLKSLTTCSKDTRVLRRWKTRDKFSHTKARNQIPCTFQRWTARDGFCQSEA